MELSIIILLEIIFFTYLGYPILLNILSLFGKSNKYPSQLNSWPSVSLLIAAYNEEQGIEEKIKNSLKLDYPQDKLEIVVVSDGSTDRTDEIVQQYADQGIKLLRVEGRVGKTMARNVAVSKSTSEIIVFSDATAEYQSDAIKQLVVCLDDPSVGMVSGNLIYRDKTNSSMGLATKLYWQYEKLIKGAQSRLNTLTGAIGCINAFRRKLYRELPAHIIEDFTEPLMILQQGYRIVYAVKAIAYERTTQQASQEFHMRVRVIRGGMTGLLFARSVLNPLRFPLASFQLIGHKVLRWLVPLFLIMLLLLTTWGAFTTNVAWVKILWSMQIIFYLLAIVGIVFTPQGIVKKILSIPSYFVIVNAAALVALYKVLTTKLEPTWETNVY